MNVEDVPVKPPEGWVVNAIGAIRRNSGEVELRVFMQKPDPERKLPYADWPMLRFDAKFDNEQATHDVEFWTEIMQSVADFDAKIVTVLPE